MWSTIVLKKEGGLVHQTTRTYEVDRDKWIWWFTMKILKPRNNTTIAPETAAEYLDVPLIKYTLLIPVHVYSSIGLQYQSYQDLKSYLCFTDNTHSDTAADKCHSDPCVFGDYFALCTPLA